MLKKIVVIILAFVLISVFVNAQIEVDEQPDEEEVDAVILGIVEEPTFNNNTANVNASELWLTVEGIMDDVSDLFPTLNDEYVNEAGDNMTGSLRQVGSGTNFIHTDEFDFYPYDQNTLGLRIYNTTDHMVLQALGSSVLEINSADTFLANMIQAVDWTNLTLDAHSWTQNQHFSSVNNWEITTTSIDPPPLESINIDRNTGADVFVTLENSGAGSYQLTNRGNIKFGDPAVATAVLTADTSGDDDTLKYDGTNQLWKFDKILSLSTADGNTKGFLFVDDTNPLSNFTYTTTVAGHITNAELNIGDLLINSGRITVNNDTIFKGNITADLFCQTDDGCFNLTQVSDKTNIAYKNETNNFTVPQIFDKNISVNEKINLNNHSIYEDGNYLTFSEQIGGTTVSIQNRTIIGSFNIPVLSATGDFNFMAIQDRLYVLQNSGTAYITLSNIDASQIANIGLVLASDTMSFSGASGGYYFDDVIDATRYIRRFGDANTYIDFTDDQIDLRAGNRIMLRLDESGTDTVYLDGDAYDFNNVPEAVNTSTSMFLCIDSDGTVFKNETTC